MGAGQGQRMAVGLRVAIDSFGQLWCLWQVDDALGDSLGDYRGRVTGF